MKANSAPDEKEDEFDPGPTSQEQYHIIERLVIGLILAWVVVGFGLPSFWSCDPTQRGTFGDQFGAVNSLFAGGAFAGVIYTIWLQRQELRLQRHELRMQRRELELNRREMENSTHAQSASAKALEKQVNLAAEAACVSGLASLLEEATNRVNSLQQGQRLDNNNVPYYYAGEYKRDLAEAQRKQNELKMRLESLTESLVDKIN